jgi:hypothetical protein
MGKLTDDHAVAIEEDGGGRHPGSPGRGRNRGGHGGPDPRLHALGLEFHR